MDPIRLLQNVVNNPLVRAAAQRGFMARDAALVARDQLLGLLNVPTAADVTMLAGRLRSIASRLEMLEDSVARVDHGVAALRAAEADRPVVSS